VANKAKPHNTIKRRSALAVPVTPMASGDIDVGFSNNGASDIRDSFFHTGNERHTTKPIIGANERPDDLHG
jgi:hypothetical protein